MMSVLGGVGCALLLQLFLSRVLLSSTLLFFFGDARLGADSRDQRNRSQRKNRTCCSVLFFCVLNTFFRTTEKSEHLFEPEGQQQKKMRCMQQG